MSRTALAGAALLAVLVGCRDGPIALDMPVDPQTPMGAQPAVQTDALISMQQMLDDPLVLEVVAALEDQAVAHGFDDIGDELDRGDIGALHRALMLTVSLVSNDSDGPDIVLRDVLKLVLDDAQMMLTGDMTQPGEAGREPVKQAERVNY